MNTDPESMNDAKVRGIVLLVLSLLLVVILILLVRTVRAPKTARQSTTVPGSRSTTVPEGAVNFGIVPTSVPMATEEPTPVPTATPDPTPRPSPTPRPTEIASLRKGDKNDQVRFMQQKLIELGYLKQGDADGTFGKGTKIAVQEFQKNNGLAPDGVAGRETITRMFGPDAR